MQFLLKDFFNFSFLFFVLKFHCLAKAFYGLDIDAQCTKNPDLFFLDLQKLNTCFKEIQELNDSSNYIV